LQSLALTGSAANNPEILEGVQAIKWNKKRNVKANYGLGGNVVNRGFGNTEVEASITLDYNTQVALRGSNASLMDIGEFDLIVSWVNEFDDTFTTETVTLKGCFFNEDGLEVSQDDTQITKEFDLNPKSIVVSPAA
jgi:hypothetical protein